MRFIWLAFTFLCIILTLERRTLCTANQQNEYKRIQQLLDNWAQITAYLDKDILNAIKTADRNSLIQWLVSLHNMKCSIHELRKEASTARNDLDNLLERQTGYTRIQLCEVLRDTEWKIDIAEHAIENKLTEVYQTFADPADI